MTWSSMFLKWPVLSALFFLIAGMCHAQNGRGTISGTVTDTQNASIANVTVEITNTGTNEVFRTTTNEQGFYTAPGLTVGSYQVSAAAPNFKRSVRTGLGLEVDQHEQVNFRLEIGAVAESIEVTGEAPLVDADSATVGKVIENRRVEDLPLNGRNALALVMLAPSVKSNAGPTNSGFADRGVQLSEISINGGPSSLNNVTLDGGTNQNSYYGEVNISPTVDSVQEFKVQTGTMSAEFGYTAGGVINIVSKSGTNEFHGTLYEFLRNSAIQARNTFTLVKP